MNHQFPACDSVNAVSSPPASIGRTHLRHAYGNDSKLSDRRVPISRTELGRVVLLATEVGARFSRDGVPYDPAAWMVAPRRLFGGRSAIDACRQEGPFMRGMLLHGLSIGLDAEPEDLDALMRDQDVPKGEQGDNRPILVAASWPDPRLELYTAIIVDEEEGCSCHVFQATMAIEPEDALEALRDRVGERMCRHAEIKRGFDPSHPIACAHVSAAIGEVLHDVAADPTSVLARGLNVFIEHRFRC